MLCRARGFVLLFLLLAVAVMAQETSNNNISFVGEFTVPVQPPSTAPTGQQVIMEELIKTGERLLYPIAHFFDNLDANHYHTKT
jgi:hypothetical protein